MVCGQELRRVLLCYHMKAADHNSWPCSYHVNVCALRLPHASRRPQNGESGDVPPSGRGLVARPAAEGLHGRAEDTTLHPAAPTPPPSADSPMHSTRAQDAAEPCIADFRRSPSGLHEPKDEWLLPDENGHFATFLIISQPPILKRNPPRGEFVRSILRGHLPSCICFLDESIFRQSRQVVASCDLDGSARKRRRPRA